MPELYLPGTPCTGKFATWAVAPRAPDEEEDQLTPREHEIAQLVATGATNPEIAEQLGLSRNTVKTYLTLAMRKLAVRNRTELAMWVVENWGEPLMTGTRMYVAINLTRTGNDGRGLSDDEKLNLLEEELPQSIEAADGTTYELKVLGAGLTINKMQLSVGDRAIAERQHGAVRSL